MNSGPDLRAIVAEVVRESVAEMMRSSPKRQEPSPPSAQSSEAQTLGAQYVTPRSDRIRTEQVRIANDRDLDQFARRLLEMFDNPKNRADLRNGWLRFSLLGAAPATTHLAGPRTASGPLAGARQITRGAVTERDVTAAAEAGHALMLGKSAVLTPLARERAQALGVHIEKEKR